MNVARNGGDRCVETIAAIATARGRAGIGVLRLSGPQAFAIAEKIAGPLPAPRCAALRRFHDERGACCDQGLLLCFAAPHSYTGEDVAELQGHGGPVLLDLLLRAACAQGARVARPGEFSERAFLNDKLDLAQAEAVADLIDAGSRAAVLAAQRSLQGEFSLQAEALAAELLELRVFVEGALDFSDDDVDWLGDARLRTRIDAARQHLDQLLTQATQGRRLREGMVVAIIGRPNVGKSTLLNALAGVPAAIVSDTPGTTRDLLREHLLIDGLPLTVLDTAGLRDTTDEVEAEGVRRAWKSLEAAELALFVGDDREGLTPADEVLLARLPSALRRLILFNKCDLSARAPEAFTHAQDEALRLSAASGEGLDLLRHALLRRAGLGEATEGVFSARTRHVQALREAAAHLAAASAQLDACVQAELAAEELRLAHAALARITGRADSETLLGEIFSRFCIGK